MHSYSLTKRILRYELMKLIIACVGVVILVGCAHHGHQQAQAVVQSKPVPSSLINPNTTLVETNFVTVYVAGEVKYPGRITWTPRLTLTEAIALAGGFTDFADREEIEIQSFGGADKKYNYHQAESAAMSNPSLKRGDFVRVGRRFF
jgi:protein involved in polysaccharide export with SLBB domain